MKNLNYASKPDERTAELRLITRSLMLLALVTSILYIRVFASTTLPTLEADGRGGIGLFSFLFLITAAAGLLLTWRWDGLGGFLVFASGIGLSILTFFMATEAPWLTAFFYGSPFVITGSLCLVCWWKGRVRNTGL